MSKLPIVERLEELLAEAEQDRVDDMNAAEVTGERPDMWDYMVELTEDDAEEIAATITELVSALKDAPEPYEYMSKADFASLPYPMRSFVDSHKTWLRKVDTALSNTRGDTP